MSNKSSDMNKTQVFTTGPKAVLIITPDGRLEAGEGLSHDEVSRELFKICSTYYGTRTAELERENAALRAAIAESEEFGRKNGETLAAKVSELLRENAALRDTVEQWKCRYYDVADAICRESNGIEDLCRQARALRADKSRLDWLDKNMTARDSFQTFEKKVLIGEIRKAIDAAMHRQEKQLWRRSYE